MNGSTDWLSAIGILLSGLVLGFMFIYAFTRRKGMGAPAAPPQDQILLDLEARRDALVVQLRELEDEGALPAERARVEREAAEVLRAIDERTKSKKISPRAVSSPLAAPAVAVTDAEAGFFVRNPAVKGFAWGVGSVAAVALLGFYVYSSASQRNPNDSATGGMPGQTQSASAMPQQADPAVTQLEQLVRSNPDDANARIELARAYLDRENLMGVFEQTQAVLAKNPAEPRAQTYNAIVQMAMGKLEDAKKMLDSATLTDPSLTDAWVAKAWIALRQGKKDDAGAAIQAAIKAHPDQKARLEEVFTQMQTTPTEVAGAPPVNGGPSALPQGHPAIDGSAPAAGAAVAPVDAASAIHLTLNLDQAAKSRQGVLYIIARANGQMSGVPVAVKRLEAGVFPLKVDFSAADSMMGQPLPQKVHIEARLDSDGDVVTKNDADPKAQADNVAAGAQVALTLK